MITLYLGLRDITSQPPPAGTRGSGSATVNILHLAPPPAGTISSSYFTITILHVGAPPPAVLHVVVTLP